MKQNPPLAMNHNPRRTPIFKRASLRLGSLALAACAGCQVLNYEGADGARFLRASFGANIALSSLAFESTTNGIKRIELRGYQNDSAQALGVVTEAAVRGAIHGAK